MGKEKRQERRARRQARRERIGNLSELAKKLDLQQIKSVDDFLHNFKTLWPFVSEALVLIKSITREKGDKAIDTVIELGGRLATGNATAEEESKFFQVFGTVWGGVRVALNLIALISRNEKVDDVIDDIIQIGDLINDYEPAAEVEGV